MPDKYIVHKAIAPEKVKVKLRQSLDYYSANYIAQKKYDGCCAVIAIPPITSNLAPSAQSRTAEVVRSMDRQAFALAADLAVVAMQHDGIVCIGEAWWPGKDMFNRISGDFRRHSQSHLMQFVLNDVLTMAEFEAGYSPVPYAERMARIDGYCPQHTKGDWFTVEAQPPGQYGDAQALCNVLADEGGYDGLILRDPSGTWTKGHVGNTGEIIKIKRELSFDLRVKEVNTAKGEKTGRDVYKLVVDFKGKDLGVGSGLPHDLAAVPKVGDIVEVVAMDYSSDGLLREPRYRGIRHDKLAPDD